MGGRWVISPDSNQAVNLDVEASLLVGQPLVAGEWVVYASGPIVLSPVRTTQAAAQADLAVLVDRYEPIFAS